MSTHNHLLYFVRFCTGEPQKQRAKTYNQKHRQVFVHDLFINYVAISVDLDTAERFAWEVARVDTRQ